MYFKTNNYFTQAMNLLSSILLLLVVDVIAGGSYCDENINIDEKQIDYSFYEDHGSYSYDLSWTNAFENKTILYECVDQLVLYFGCKDEETCCDSSKHGDDTTITKYPRMDNHSIPFSDCGFPGQRIYICLYFWIINQPKPIKKTKRLKGLICPEQCDRYEWREFTDVLKSSKYKYGITQQIDKQGHLTLDWWSNLGTMVQCLEVTIQYVSRIKN